MRSQQETTPTSRKAEIANVMNRLASPDFPAELLLQVVETAVVSQVGHWNVSVYHNLGALATSLFAWPKGVTSATRRLLQQTAATALLKCGIIRIPADLDELRPAKYEVPPALLGKENQVKLLVLDLDIHVGGLLDGELAVSAGHMNLLAEAFPRLEVCTYLLHIGYDSDVVPSGGYIDVSILGHVKYKLKKASTAPDAPSLIVKCTVEDNLVDFIAAFVKSGPGRRKLIRFSRQRPEFLSIRGPPPREFRPLVRVSSPDASPTAGATETTLGHEENESLINAKRILDEAYRGAWDFR